MKRASAGSGRELRSDGDESKELPPPGWKRNPILLVLRGVDEVLSSHLFLAAHEKAPLAQYRHILAAFEMSAHSAVWIGGLTFLLWFFAFDVPVRTFFLNVFLAVLVDAVLMAMLKAAASQRDCDEQQSSTLGFPSNFTSRAVLVTLVVVNRTGAFCMLKAFFVTWCIGVALTKTLLGKHYLGDSLMGAALGYLEYRIVVEPIWCSEEMVSVLFKAFCALEEPTHDSLLW
ncbi:polyisoprenoid diphosphate/phosphate phosphohydrolase PLPP6-like isoform X2 [Amblyomma americanum]